MRNEWGDDCLACDRIMFIPDWAGVERTGYWTICLHLPCGQAHGWSSVTRCWLSRGWTSDLVNGVPTRQREPSVKEEPVGSGKTLKRMCHQLSRSEGLSSHPDLEFWLCKEGKHSHKHHKEAADELVAWKTHLYYMITSTFWFLAQITFL